MPSDEWDCNEILYKWDFRKTCKFNGKDKFSFRYAEFLLLLRHVGQSREWKLNLRW